MYRDARAVAVSCGHRQALDLYETALWQYHSYVGDPIATIDQALAEAPEFVLGHAFRAGVLMMFREQRFVPEARASVMAAENLSGQANERERGLTRAARRLVEGDWDGACRVYDQVLVDEPRDAFAVQTAHLLDFYRGDALNLRNRISRVLPHWSAGVPHYSYILGMHAFGLEECNQYPQAEATGRKALELQPRDGWAVHAVVHVLEMQGRVDEGIDWLESREVGWPLGRGFQAFARGRYPEAIDPIEPVRDTAHRFGGSHAQRDLLTLTLIEAAIRAGQLHLARHYLAERLVHKPASGLGWRLLARTERAEPAPPVAIRKAA